MDAASLLWGIGEPYAAGLFEDMDAPRCVRYARAQRRFWENCILMPYGGERLYPCEAKMRDEYAVYPHYSYTFWYDGDRLAAKSADAERLVREEHALLRFTVPAEHTIGGNGYTHSFPNYERVAREGLDAYEVRVRNMKREDLKTALLDVLVGIRHFHARALALLEAESADPELIAALRQVPFQPARTLYEALVCRNFIYYLDFCDNPGRIDTELFPYFKGEDITAELKRFFRNVDDNDGWSGALGPDYNEITRQCLRAVKGMRRPSLELRVTRDMPEDVWALALDSIKSGCGNPSLYNEEGYQAALRATFPDIPVCDLLRMNGGGCTETMLAGISHVGSLDAGVNMALVFERSMKARLPGAADFEAFLAAFLEDANEAVRGTLEGVCAYQKLRAEYRPQPVRTLLVDDCIEKERDFNDSGARYDWSVINVAGLINVIDGMLAVRHMVFDTGACTGEAFCELLEKEDEAFYLALRKAPCYGRDDAEADALAGRISQAVFAMFDQMKPYCGGRFLPGSIQFATYADAGKCVGATPDGRRKGEPLCDSLSAIHGKDDLGPTALLNSICKLDLRHAVGTPVVNLRLDPKHVASHLKPLVRGFFDMGGMQIQITCNDRKVMEDAMIHPEKHEDLIVRIGGYAEYFNRLSCELKRTVLERTEH